MTFWELVTGNSNLPVASENTFWDHINNQKTGGGTGTVIVGSEAALEINNALTLEIGDNSMLVDADTAIELQINNSIKLELNNDKELK